jgi:hypothetical protein
MTGVHRCGKGAEGLLYDNHVKKNPILLPRRRALFDQGRWRTVYRLIDPVRWWVTIRMYAPESECACLRPVVQHASDGVCLEDLVWVQKPLLACSTADAPHVVTLPDRGEGRFEELTPLDIGWSVRTCSNGPVEHYWVPANNLYPDRCWCQIDW